VKLLKCASFDGIDAKKIDVEASLNKGLPSFNIVGLASNDIQESRERVKAALTDSGFKFAPMKITVNLSPSSLKKDGSHFDLSIALLIALHDTTSYFSDWFVFGELGLDGRIKETPTIFALLLSLAKQLTHFRALVPIGALKKCRSIPGIELLGAQTLKEAIEIFSNEQIPTLRSIPVELPIVTIEKQNYYTHSKYNLDFKDVRGQKRAKKAALIAAAGEHNLLLDGSPGSGKTMIAKRMQYILSPLSHNELLDITQIRSFDNEESEFSALRPFRSVHHSASKASILGGGAYKAKIGEIALSHRGILFFDELPHFPKNILEALREPLEDRKILISRVNSKITYETDFIFVSAMNPCPCGNLYSTKKSCRCTDLEITRYKNRLSEPLYDRIDLYVQMQESNHSDKAGENSQTMHSYVLQALKQRIKRGQNMPNGRLNEVDTEKYCKLGEDCEKLLIQASQKFALSARSISKIKQISRTIADLATNEEIKKEHISEALGFRKR